MKVNENKAGIYIHIPFCKQACTYCNFHFSTSLKLKDDLIKALKTEIGQRKNYLEERVVQSIYFGGGTPSLLSSADIFGIVNAIYKNFPVDEDTEITIEANPDDIESQKLQELKSGGVNRISLGIQSFFDVDLKQMNRSHNALQAEKSLQLISEGGFDNITADLIYGIPGQSHAAWEKNIRTLLSYNIDHISAYALTVEPKTALYHQVTTKKIAAPDDVHSAEQFDILVELLIANGFEHYEISNFARNQKYSRHNTSYWFGNWYAGFGPSAHSYNGISRQWNISNNAVYIKNIQNQEPIFETEELTLTQQINEFIMVSLRTMWGLDKNNFKRRFGEQKLNDLMLEAENHILNEYMREEEGKLIISAKGKFISDGIIGDLFFMG